jgi:hypothetical protein
MISTFVCFIIFICIYLYIFRYIVQDKGLEVLRPGVDLYLRHFKKLEHSLFCLVLKPGKLKHTRRSIECPRSGVGSLICAGLPSNYQWYF